MGCAGLTNFYGRWVVVGMAAAVHISSEKAAHWHSTAGTLFSWCFGMFLWRFLLGRCFCNAPHCSGGTGKKRLQKKANPAERGFSEPGGSTSFRAAMQSALDQNLLCSVSRCQGGFNRPGIANRYLLLAIYCAYLRLASSTHLSLASPDMASQRSLAAL